MQTLEVWADTKSCRDISCLFKDYLVWLEPSRFLGEKILVAIVGLEPGTPGSVVQRFNHLATKQPPTSQPHALPSSHFPILTLPSSPSQPNTLPSSPSQPNTLTLSSLTLTLSSLTLTLSQTNSHSPHLTLSHLTLNTTPILSTSLYPYSFLSLPSLPLSTLPLHATALICGLLSCVLLSSQAASGQVHLARQTPLQP